MHTGSNLNLDFSLSRFSIFLAVKRLDVPLAVTVAVIESPLLE